VPQILQSCTPNTTVGPQILKLRPKYCKVGPQILQLDPKLYPEVVNVAKLHPNIAKLLPNIIYCKSAPEILQSCTPNPAKLHPKSCKLAPCNAKPCKAAPQDENPPRSRVPAAAKLRPARTNAATLRPDTPKAATLHPGSRPAAPHLRGARGAEELAVDQHVLGAGGLREADALHELVDAGRPAVPERRAGAGLRLRRGVARLLLAAREKKRRGRQREGRDAEVSEQRNRAGFCRATSP